jgi:outer membrane protein, multidrug efflux system
MITRLLVAAAVSGALAACTVGPNYARPKPDVPLRWSRAAVSGVNEGPARVTSDTPPDVTWWTSFDDPLLSSLVERSVTRNLDLRAALLRVRESQAEAAAVRGGLWPSVSAESSWARQRISTNTPDGVIFDLSGAPGLPLDLTNPYNQEQFGLAASWNTDLFGGVRRSVEAANAQTQVALEEAHGALLTMQSNVAQAYIGLRGAQLERAILLRSLDTQLDLLALTRSRRSAGLTSDLDVEYAATEVNTTRAQLPVAGRRITVEINELSELMARPPEALRTELVQARPVPPVPPRVPIGIPSDLLRRRPDIRAAEANLHAATARIGVAVANFFPQLTITAAGEYQSVGFSKLVDAASRFASFGPAIELPIFEGGRLRATLRLRRFEAKEAAVVYARAVLLALQQVEDALAAYGSDQARRESLQAAVTSSKNALTLARQRYAGGVASFIDVLDAERTEEGNELSLARSTTAVSEDLVQLYVALGGGWQTHFLYPSAHQSLTNAAY